MISYKKAFATFFAIWFLFCIYLSVKEKPSMAHFVIDNIVNIAVMIYCMFSYKNVENHILHFLGSFLFGILAYYLYIDMTTPTDTPGIWMAYAIVNIMFMFYVLINQYPYLMNVVSETAVNIIRDVKGTCEHRDVVSNYNSVLLYANILTAVIGFFILKIA